METLQVEIIFTALQFCNVEAFVWRFILQFYDVEGLETKVREISLFKEEFISWPAEGVNIDKNKAGLEAVII